MRKILGLDLGTNSIGWSVVSVNEENNPFAIEGMGSRIIPISQDILGLFDSGQSWSQTAERTGFRGTRRLRERHLLRRERLHRVLHQLDFLPSHYEEFIDFDQYLGKYTTDTEPKLAWKRNDNGTFDFLFQASFHEMLEEFHLAHPGLALTQQKIPYDWTIYYLRKKAIEKKISKEELSWILLNFNQKRGYYQLRGEDEEENTKRRVEYHALSITDVTADEPQKGRTDIWYNITLENGWEYRRSSRIPLFDWIGKTKDFIVSTDLNPDGSIKIDKEGKESRSFRAPGADDWNLLKKKTEADIDNKGQTVGTYIYDSLLANPNQKIKGKLVRTIERKFYKEELRQILNKQKEFHPELQNKNMLCQCIEELYPYNEAHQRKLIEGDFTSLFMDDILFYQRPLKSKKSQISNCSYEQRRYKNADGAYEIVPIKCIAKSNPLFQEFRLWQFIHNLRIYEREKEVLGKLETDVDVTAILLPTREKRAELFEWLNDRKEIKQDTLLNSFFKIKKGKGESVYPSRWNYVEDKVYPCNETRGFILSALSKAEIDKEFLTKDIEMSLWHLLYSVEDRYEIENALRTFASKHGLKDSFKEVFARLQPFKKDYGAYSEKAIKKLLPLMRIGKYWKEEEIDKGTLKRIQSIMDRLKHLKESNTDLENVSDDDIPKPVLKSFLQIERQNGDFYSGLNTYQACYAVYGRHSESSEVVIWKAPQDIDSFLRDFKQHSLRNPIVEQVITETLRVVRDLWKKYGDFYEIHLELGREMKNPADKRARISQQIADNENTNLRIKALLMELKNHHDVDNVRPHSPSQLEILRIYEEGVLNAYDEIDDEIIKISKKAQPTQSELIRYKLWLEQKYRSPYTNTLIPLGKLFTSAYEIEHIIPQSRYFDDSFNNKVICEAEVNKLKDNALGYEFIKNHGGEKVQLSMGGTVEILSVGEYERFVKANYKGLSTKMRNLLLEDIPDSFIERQLNDSRYISKVIQGLLSNIVREENEQEPTSKHLISCTGGVTNRLKNEWGLNDIWNKLISPRFERLNRITGTDHFGQWVNKEGKNFFQTEVPLELQKGFNKKRIDHRHHALDALVIACATRNHINYLNNESARKNAKISRHDLKNKLCYKSKADDRGNYQWRFHKPWDTFTQDAFNNLNNIIVSFKQNKRVINKTINHIQSYKDESGTLQLGKNGKPVKVLRKQIKGDNWAIRKALHKDTVAGIVNLRFKKQVALSAAIDQYESIVNKSLKTKITQLLSEGFDKKKIQKFFKNMDNKWAGIDISKPEVYYFSNDKEVLVASRTSLDASFNSKKIASITDTGIQSILYRHLAKYNEERNGNIVEHPELAFSPEGIEEMNKNITELNNGKQHKPILKVRTYEPKGSKFNVGNSGNKKDKYVVAAKGTNLFFAIYVDEQGKRSFDTIPFNIVVERLKQGMTEVAEQNENGDKLLFSLSPNDLVYVPTEDEVESNNIAQIKVDRIYKFVDSSGTTANFVPMHVSSLIFNLNQKEQEKRGLKYIIQNEYGIGSPQSKSQNSTDGIQIKQYGIKLEVDRLGNIMKI